MRPARPCAPGLSRPSETTPALIDLSRRTQSTSCSAQAGARLHLAEGHHLGVAAHPAWRAESQRKFGREIEAAPGLEDVEGRDVESVALVGVEQRDLGQRDADRPYALLPAALVEQPENERRQAIEDRFRAEREIDGLVMLDDQMRRRDRRDRPQATRDRHARRGWRRPRRESACCAARGRRSPVRVRPRRSGPRRSSVASRSATTARPSSASRSMSRRVVATPERMSVEDGREARAAAFDRARTADAPTGGRLGLGLGLQVVIHRKRVARRGIGILSRRFCHIKRSLSLRYGIQK